MFCNLSTYPTLGEKNFNISTKDRKLHNNLFIVISFNIFTHIHYKDSGILVTLYRPHRKFIVNKHNFK